MIGLSAALLTFGFFRVYSRPSTTEEPHPDVGLGRSLRRRRGDALRGDLREGRRRGARGRDEPGTRRIVVHIDNIEFAACCEGPAKETLGALPGVRKVRINHRRKEAILIVRPDAEIDNAMVVRAR